MAKLLNWKAFLVVVKKSKLYVLSCEKFISTYFLYFTLVKVVDYFQF